MRMKIYLSNLARPLNRPTLIEEHDTTLEGLRAIVNRPGLLESLKPGPESMLIVSIQPAKPGEAARAA